MRPSLPEQPEQPEPPEPPDRSNRPDRSSRPDRPAAATADPATRAGRPATAPADQQARAAGHATNELLAGYAAGSLDGVAAWSVEAHLTTCDPCRSALSSYAGAQRVARNRSVLLARVAIPEGGWASRVLGRIGFPDHVLRLLAATPSLRRSWLLAVGAVLATVTGETLLVRYLWSRHIGHMPADSGILVPFLLVAPLLVLAAVAAAFLPVFDPAYWLAVAAPVSGFTLLLIRTVSALVAALIPVVCVAFVVPGPEWLPAALLLPSLALCAFALAAITVVGPRLAAIASGALWAVPVVLLALTHPPLAVVQWHSQVICAAVLLGAVAMVGLRRERFEFGWPR